MTDRQIRCFLALYETLNFSAAARQLFLTQPTLSYQIRTLEEELGTPLFTRTTCRVEPTEAGQLFAAFAQNVRQSYQAFQHALAAGPARREKLVLQVPLTMASRDLVYHDLLMALSQELPDCDLEVRTDTSCTSPEEVLQSGVDALIQILLEPVSDAIDCLPLFDTKCHLLASPGSPLSACGTLTPDQLAGQTICFESCDAVFVSMLRRCMEDIPLRWLMVPDFEKEYVRMLAGKCLFLSPVRSHGYPPEWFHPLSFPFPPAPTCLFTRKDDTRPCLQVLRQLTLAEHQRAVAQAAAAVPAPMRVPVAVPVATDVPAMVAMAPPMVPPKVAPVRIMERTNMMVPPIINGVKRSGIHRAPARKAAFQRLCWGEAPCCDFIIQHRKWNCYVTKNFVFCSKFK